LEEGKFCDVEYHRNSAILADYKIEDDYLKIPSKRQKSMKEEISEDRSILHPKKQMLDP